MTSKHIALESRRSASRKFRSRQSWSNVTAGIESLEARTLLSAMLGGDADHNELTHQLVTTAAHSGGSPFAPPEEGNSVFVVDEGNGLDTGCTYASTLTITLELDRYLGNIGALKNAGLLPQMVELRMPAFDVDFNASSSTPERDKVYFNGHLVSGEYLTGENNVWKMNTFQIPLDWINFPSDPGSGQLDAAENTIDIEIDTLDGGWCTAIDWVALTVPSPDPVFFVHGILSNSTGWKQLWEPNLAAMGIPVADIDLGGTFGIALDSIQNNSVKISAKIAELQSRWGFQSIDFVTHSKGGLDSREFVEGLLYDADPDNDDLVDTLVQIGTPNGGSPLADWLETEVAKLAIKGGVLGVALDGLLNAFVTPAGYQLTTPYMALYNQFHSYNPNTNYVSLAGDYDPNGIFSDPIGEFLETIVGAPGDSIVPVGSVWSLGYATHLQYSSTSPNGQATHADRPGAHPGEVLSQSIYNLLSGYVSTSSSAIPSTQPPTSASQVAATSSGSPTPSTETLVGSIGAGETQVQELVLDGGQECFLSMLYSGGNLDLTLINPSGQEITPANASSFPGVTFSSSESTAGFKMEVVHIDSTTGGTWKLKVRGVSVQNSSGKEGYMLSGIFPQSQLNLTASVDKSSYGVGTPIRIEGTVKNGQAAVAGASVKAYVVSPDGTSTETMLFDDGTHGDTTANDGKYSIVLQGFAEEGNYVVIVEGKGTTPHAFSRQDSVFFSVAELKGEFDGTFTEETRDTNGNGLYDDLVIRAGVDISVEGFFRAVGQLRDSSGNLIDEGSFAGTLSPADTSIDLVFDGNAIYRNGKNGPYTLSLALLGQESNNAIIPVQELSMPYQTTAYDFHSFEHAEIAAVGLSKDEGRDTNSNGRFDVLELGLDIDVVTEADYNWSGRLVDSHGHEIGFASGSGHLTSGRNTLSFGFDGQKIGSHGEDGPYFLTDLLINGPGVGTLIVDKFATRSYSASQFEGGPVGNHAPVLNPNGNPNLSNIHEDIPLSSIGGNYINDLIARMAPGGGITDPDAGALKGIAVIGANQLSGTWQFTVDGGTAWKNFGATNVGSALLLAADSQTKVRFVPKSNYTGTVGFTFIAWDRTSGANGTVADTSVRGNSSAFSTQKENSFITVNPINDAPVLNPNGNPTISRGTGDSPSVSNLGTLVSSVLERMQPNGGIKDVDANAAQGLAVIGSNQTGGVWEYSLNGGGVWKPFGATSNTSALLLAADASTRVRFVPGPNFSGETGFTFVAWDRTTGSNGQIANATVRGGTSSLSIDKENCILTDGGNVQVFVAGGGVSLIGDAFGNDVDLIFNANGTVTVRGNRGTWINGQAGPIAVFATTLGSLLMKEGSDRVRVLSDHAIQTERDVRLEMGAGDDLLRLERVTTRRRSQVLLGLGRDRLELLDAVFSGQTTMDNGPEDTVVNV